MRAHGGSGLLRIGARRSKARRQAQAATGLRTVVAQARGSDCLGSADGGAGLAQGTEALGRGDSGRNVIRNEVGPPFLKTYQATERFQG